jgi:tripartite-type tricarboxylate transporter receptor subunit TctC
MEMDDGLATSPQGTLQRRRLLAAFLGAMVVPLVAQAQAFPTRAVYLIVPQPPGGAADRLGRFLAERLGALWEQSVIVENKAGGGVAVGTVATARAERDGYTLGLLGSSLTINAIQRRDLPYRLSDLEPIARVGYYTMALVASANFPADDVKGLIALAKSKPANFLSYGSNGIGTSAQVAGELLNHMAGIETQHIPYNGASKMYTDILGGRIPLGFAVYSSAVSFVRAGQMKVLGVTSERRSPQYPDVPTIAETLPGFDVVNWAGILSPADLSPETLEKVSTDLLRVLEGPDVARKLGEMGIDLAPLGPEQFKAFIAGELQRFSKVMKPLSERLG